MSASIAVKVQTSPAYPVRSHTAGVTFFCLAATKLQISSTWTRFAGTLQMVASRYSWQAFGDAHQQPKDSALRYASQPNGRANRAPFDQRRDDRDFLRRADYVCHGSTIRHRFRIVNSKVMGKAFLLAVLRFCPTRFSGLTCASFALLIGHGFESTLPADLTALSTHLAHDLLNDGKFHGLCSFQEHALRVLNSVKFWSSAFPLWHTPKRCTYYRTRQEGAISNRPTT